MSECPACQWNEKGVDPAPMYHTCGKAEPARECAACCQNKSSWGHFWEPMSHTCTPAPADTPEPLAQLADPPPGLFDYSETETADPQAQRAADTKAMSVDEGHDRLCTVYQCQGGCLYWRILEAVRRGGSHQCAECDATQSKNGEWYCETCVVAGLEEVGGHD